MLIFFYSRILAFCGLLFFPITSQIKMGSKKPYALPSVFAFCGCPLASGFFGNAQVVLWILRPVAFQRRRVGQQAVELIGGFLPTRHVGAHGCRPERRIVASCGHDPDSSRRCMGCCCCRRESVPFHGVDMTYTAQLVIPLDLIQFSGTKHLFHLSFPGERFLLFVLVLSSLRLLRIMIFC